MGWRFKGAVFALSLMMAATAWGEEILTLEDCMDMASLHPDLVAADRQIDLSDARLSKAASPWRTTLSLKDRYTVQEGRDGSHSGSLGLSQRIFDSGVTGLAVRSSKEDRLSSVEDRASVLQEIRYSVAQSYCTLLNSHEDLSIARELTEQDRRHLEIVQGMYDVGEKPLIDVTQARVNLNKSQLELVRAKHQVELSKNQLDHAIGREMAQYRIAPISPQARPVITLDEAISLALENHPDIRSYRHSVKSARTSVSSAARGMSPTVNATAGYSWSGNGLLEDGQWSMAVEGTIPMADGGITKAQTDEAKATLGITEAKAKRAAQSVELAVRKAWLELDEAEESLSVARESVEQAKANLSLANGRYEVGEGSPGEVADAVTSYGQARKSLASAYYGREVAVAALRKAMGVL
nr:TolC family protein [uncultured Dethiosulfovibrio sp.]